MSENTSTCLSNLKWVRRCNIFDEIGWTLMFPSEVKPKVILVVKGNQFKGYQFTNWCLDKTHQYKYVTECLGFSTLDEAKEAALEAASRSDHDDIF